MRAAIAFAAVAVLTASSPARAQSWEASGLIGFTPSATIDKRSSDLTDADIRGEITWGLQGARFFTPLLGAEVLWTQQSSALEVGTSDGKADLLRCAPQDVVLRIVQHAAIVGIRANEPTVKT